MDTVTSVDSPAQVSDADQDEPMPAAYPESTPQAGPKFLLSSDSEPAEASSGR